MNNNTSNSIRQGPSSLANSPSVSQEIPHLLLNLVSWNCVQKGPPLDPFLSQLNSFHTFTPYFFKIHFSIILPSSPRFPKWLISSL
jgi:hypothetical protein